jgi:hypothetical protein
MKHVWHSAVASADPVIDHSLASCQHGFVTFFKARMCLPHVVDVPYVFRYQRILQPCGSRIADLGECASTGI